MLGSRLLTQTPPSYPEDLVRFVKEGRFKALVGDIHRFQVNYLSYHDIPTENDLCVEMCRFAIASFNSREVCMVFVLVVAMKMVYSIEHYIIMMSSVSARL